MIAIQRFGLGAGPGELARMGRDPLPWLLAQLDQPTELPADDRIPDSLGAMDHFIRRLELVRSRNAREKAGETLIPLSREIVDFLHPNDIVQANLAQGLATAIATPAPLLERLALHWINHFTASLATAGVYLGYFGAAFEREAIRPHMLGRFEDMLFASSTHTAMLFYLDNRRSVGPNSPSGKRRGRGLNENLAREILELHSLGVDGGYTQDDVIALARILTGWSAEIDRPAPSIAARMGFFPEFHEPGPQVVLGRRYADTGPDQLKAVLHDLAEHPSTARHVSRRLVRHFIGDAAPPDLVPALARIFQDSGGDLKAVTAGLLCSPAAAAPAARIRPPIELLLGTARLLGQPPEPPRPMLALAAMGQPFRGPASPAGWPEEDDAWAAPDAIKTRLDWAIALAARQPARLDARALLDQAYGPAASPELRRAVGRAADARQALVLLLMSPEYQRR